ncbi:RICIN domain-containing protein [Streptomyces griseoviridis]
MAARAGALLLARHWRAAQEYAVICMASTEASASMVAAAAFHRVLDRPGEGAFRPQLLSTVRDMVKQWAADDSISGALPELRKPTGGRGLRIARRATSERRQLAERAFQGLPEAAQCLLWHIEVEAEPISVPAVLLAVDEVTTAFELEQARAQFRTAILRAHRELAPTPECRFHNRLLATPVGRGGALLSDVQRHLGECRYCRHAAEQFSHLDGGLDVLLAETVLGWGAHRYLASRPGRGGTPPGPPRRPRGGRHRPVAPRPSRKALAVGVAAVSLTLLATVLVTRSWGDDNGVRDPHTNWGASSGGSVASAPPSPDGSPSAASADRPPAEVGRGRLRNPAAGLCLDAVAGRAVLAGCSSAASQRWSYLDDGLLRNAADLTSCLVSDPGLGTVTVADCAVHAAESRYDLTVRGELLPRAGAGRLVASGKDTTVVIARRDGSAGQRWVLEAGHRNTGGSDGAGVPGGTGHPGGAGATAGTGGASGTGDAGRTPGNEEPRKGSTEKGSPKKGSIKKGPRDKGMRDKGTEGKRGREDRGHAGEERAPSDAWSPRAVPSPRGPAGEERYAGRLVRVSEGGAAVPGAVEGARRLPAGPFDLVGDSVDAVPAMRAAVVATTAPDAEEASTAVTTTAPAALTRTASGAQRTGTARR